MKKGGWVKATLFTEIRGISKNIACICNWEGERERKN
jgi:hypothetical protein